MRNCQNKIKYTNCCVHCGKSYTRKISLEKHTILCGIVHMTKREKQIEEEETTNLPSQQQLYKMLLEIAHRYNVLEEKVNEIQKWTDKKKTKINIINWLNSNTSLIPQNEFNEYMNHIIVKEEDIHYLMDTNNTIIQTINKTLEDNINKDKKNIIPIFCFTQKQNIFYVYSNNKWRECEKSELIHFMNHLHRKFVKQLFEWYTNNKTMIQNNDSYAEIYNKTTLKLMSADFRQDNILTKIKTGLFNHLKYDLKNVLEYEFEF